MTGQYERGAGILMHISSLPGDKSIGTLGRPAYDFVDFLKSAGQKYWQVLPICPVGYGFSPYQSPSTFAGNPLFIDFALLEEDGLLTKKDYAKYIGKSISTVDMLLTHDRVEVLYKAFERFKTQDHTDFHRFEAENEVWISNYAMYQAGKDVFDNLPWFRWQDKIKHRDSEALWHFKNDNGDRVFFHMFVQYEFYKQWERLKKYANDNGIKIIGDIPIYVALDSADVWVSPNLFDLNADLSPSHVAGCPPDAFSATGQLWGNPIYNWTAHERDNYAWWVNRIKQSLKLYDLVRIDHFRAFASYYAISGTDKTAEHGQWIEGPGMKLFDKLEEQLGALPFIAEDLGTITPDVKELLQKTGFPGMKILEFAFDEANAPSDYLPQNHIKNCVVYPGTHDNNTILGWIEENKENAAFAKKYLGLEETATSDALRLAIIRAALMSPADISIVQLQDYLALDDKARMNTPSTVGTNWTWRWTPSQITPDLSKQIKDLTKTYFR